MKKGIFFLFLLFNLFSLTLTKANREEVEVKSFLYPDQTVIYYGSDVKVTIPASPHTYKSMFKAAYISTLENRDISDSILNGPEHFKIEYREILSTLEDHHINVVIFEIRPLLDAFYPSKINPTSQFLTGKEGNLLDWDPLEWMIEETHNRNMAFHAWMNPFLVSHHQVTENQPLQLVINELASNNFAFKNQSKLVLGKDQRLYLNPGLDEVQSYFVDTVTEVIQNYAIDGIHLNSSIYPETGMEAIYDESLADDSNDLDAFRVAKVIELVRKLSNTINTYNVQTEKSIQFGMTYDMKRDQYIDMDYLVEHNLVDYLIAQLNYAFEEADKGYADFVKEWANYMQESTVNLYIGFNVNFESPDYNRELKTKLLYLQNYQNIKGIALSQVTRLNLTKSVLLRSHTDDLFSTSQLLPAVKNVYAPTVENVSRLNLQWMDDNVHIHWGTVAKAKYYVLYRFNDDQVVQKSDLENPANILAVVKQDNRNDTIRYVDETAKQNHKYTYMVSVVDSAYNESDIPTPRSIDLTFDQDMTFKLILFSVISLVGISVIGYTSYHVLKK
jgi:uncharacterized lipoprotein YddW (UPF0748 family)